MFSYISGWVKRMKLRCPSVSPVRFFRAYVRARSTADFVWSVLHPVNAASTLTAAVRKMKNRFMRGFLHSGRPAAVRNPFDCARLVRARNKII